MGRGLLFIALLASGAAAACATSGGSTGDDARAVSGAPAGSAALRTRLAVRHTEGGTSAFVSASVAGEQVMMLVDTGAVRSILPASFVKAHALKRWPGSTDAWIVDANGETQRMPRVPDVPVQLEGAAGPVVVDFVMNPASDGVPILSPQALLRPGWAMVLDLAHETLSWEPEGAALERLRAEGVALREVESSRCEGPQRTARITLAGAAAPMLIDTGATRTFLARNHPAIPSMKSILGARTDFAAISSTGKMLFVSSVPVELAETSFDVPVGVVPTKVFCGKGVLGADLLRHCTLVWGRSSLWAACQSP